MVLPLLHWQIAPVSVTGHATAVVLQGQTWISIACCVLLLVLSKSKNAEKQHSWAQQTMVFILGGLLLALVMQYGAVPRARAGAGTVWVYVPFVMLGLQCLCALAAWWRMAGVDESTPQ